MRSSIFKALCLMALVMTSGSFASASDWGDDEPVAPPVVTYKGQKCQVNTQSSESEDNTSIACTDKSFQPSRSCVITYPRGGGELSFSISTYKESGEGDAHVRTIRRTKPVSFKFKPGSKGDLSSLLSNAMADRCGDAQAKFETHTVRQRDVNVSNHTCTYQVDTGGDSVEHSLVCENQIRDQRCTVSFTSSAPSANGAMKGRFSQSFIDYSPKAKGKVMPEAAGTLTNETALADLTKRLTSCASGLKGSSDAHSLNHSGGAVR